MKCELNVLQKRFILFACVIFILFGGSKVVGALGSHPALSRCDPVFSFLTTRQVLFLAGLLEVIVAKVLLGSGGAQIKLLLVLWMSALFASYRFAMWMSGYHGTCPCLGYIWDWLPISDSVLQKGLIVIILILGGASSLFISLSLLRRKAGF